MNRKKLEALIEKRRKKLEKLMERSNASEDVDEVRSIGSEMVELREEISELEAELSDLPQNNEEQERQDALDLQETTPFEVRGSFQQNTTHKREQDVFASEAYQNAFMNFVSRGVPITESMPELRSVYSTMKREDGTTLLTDVTAVIPTTTSNEIIRELRTSGEIWAKVRKLNVQGGVEFPILTLMPVANHIGDGETSKAQKLKADEKVSFSYNGIECKIAQSIFANVVTYKQFQDMFVPLAVEAIMVLIEHDIFKGTGKGQFTGILNDNRVKEENVIELSNSDFNSWSGWKKKVFAKMKKAYRKGEFFMAQGTFDGYIDGMTDKNDQPIGRVNYGINGEESYRFGGKNVITVEDDVIAAYEDAAAGDVVAVFAELKNYAVNSNMQMQVVKWTDHDTNEVKNKVMLIADGKLLDPNGVLIIKKGSASSSESSKG